MENIYVTKSSMPSYEEYIEAKYRNKMQDVEIAETLKEEIQERLSYDELCLSRFNENNGDYIYELEEKCGVKSK